MEQGETITGTVTHLKADLKRSKGSKPYTALQLDDDQWFMVWGDHTGSKGDTINLEVSWVGEGGSLVFAVFRALQLIVLSPDLKRERRPGVDRRSVTFLYGLDITPH